MILVPIGLAIFLWFGGYLMTTRFMSTTGVHGDDLEKIITSPKWLFYLCGAPVSQNHPKGAMRLAALRTQLQGIFLGLYVIWYVILKPHTFENAIGFLLFAVIPFILSAYVSKRFGLKNSARVEKQNK